MQLLNAVCREKLPILPPLFICRYIRCLLTTPDSLAVEHFDIAPFARIKAVVDSRGKRLLRLVEI